MARLKVPELKAALEERGLDTTGRKPVLVERLLEAVASPSVGDEGTSKKKAESPVEEPPAKKAKGKAVAKEEAAAPAEAAANEGKAASPSPAAPAAPSGGGGGRVRQPDRSVPGGASFAVHEDYDVKLMQTNIGGGRNNSGGFGGGGRDDFGGGGGGGGYGNDNRSGFGGGDDFQVGVHGKKSGSRSSRPSLTIPSFRGRK